MPTSDLRLGDCRAVMATMAPNSVDAIVTDPPYLIGFMNKDFDTQGGRHRSPEQMQSWHESWAREAYRVLRPGGHLLAFGGTRTFHRLACALEDAGFEIRDCLSWLYGSGFPKSLDVSKAIDKMAGAEREVVGSRRADDIRGGNLMHRATGADTNSHVIKITAPATDLAAQWAGWGTALKPAFEPIVLCRKPLSPTKRETVKLTPALLAEWESRRCGRE